MDIFDKTSDVISGKTEATFGVSCAAAAGAIISWRLGIAAARASHGGLFAADIALTFIFYAGFLVFWVPIIHLFAEKEVPGAKTLVRETNMAAMILALTLPAGLISRAAGAPFLASPADFIVRILFAWRLSTAIMRIYSMGRFKSAVLLAAPAALFTFWSMSAFLAGAVKLWQYLK